LPSCYPWKQCGAGGAASASGIINFNGHISVTDLQTRLSVRLKLALVRAVVLFLLGAAFACSLTAQSSSAAPAAWVVKLAWVLAHESFLASDALGGRGSATRDEAITAAYVASEFEGYGLTHAPGMSGYLQAAEVSDPKLDGHASLAVDGKTIDEGTGFSLLSASGKPVSGPIVAATDPKQIAPNTAVLLVRPVTAMGGATTGATTDAQWISAATRAGVRLLLLEQDDALRRQAARGTRIRMQLKERAEQHPALTVAVLAPEAFAAMSAQPAGTPVALLINLAPGAQPRVTTNAIGYLQGTDPAAGTLLLTAHLDHLGTRSNASGDSIYNGANDDASGTTAVLELAHALAAGPRLRRSILFVCYGSEEADELGSEYFGAHPPVPLKDLIANVEFEMIGAQDPKMPKGVLLFTGWERSNLGPELKAHGALLGPDPYPEQHFFERSDNYQLALDGVVAHTAAGWGTVPTYHQPDDDLAHLDIPFMTAAIQSLVEPIRWLASSDFRPAWNHGGRPTR
jgi:aminopeptidase YwaD